MATLNPKRDRRHQEGISRETKRARIGETDEEREKLDLSFMNLRTILTYKSIAKIYNDIPRSTLIDAFNSGKWELDDKGFRVGRYYASITYRNHYRKKAVENVRKGISEDREVDERLPNEIKDMEDELALMGKEDRNSISEELKKVPVGKRRSAANEMRKKIRLEDKRLKALEEKKKADEERSKEKSERKAAIRLKKKKDKEEKYKESLELMHMRREEYSQKGIEEKKKQMKELDLMRGEEIDQRIRERKPATKRGVDEELKAEKKVSVDEKSREKDERKMMNAEDKYQRKINRKRLAEDKKKASEQKKIDKMKKREKAAEQKKERHENDLMFAEESRQRKAVKVAEKKRESEENAMMRAEEKSQRKTEKQIKAEEKKKESEENSMMRAEEKSQRKVDKTEKLRLKTIEKAKALEQKAKEKEELKKMRAEEKAQRKVMKEEQKMKDKQNKPTPMEEDKDYDRQYHRKEEIEDNAMDYLMNVDREGMDLPSPSQLYDTTTAQIKALKKKMVIEGDKLLENEGNHEAFAKMQEKLKSLEAKAQRLEKAVYTDAKTFHTHLRDKSEEFNDQIDFLYQPYTRGKVHKVYENFPQLYKLQNEIRSDIDTLTKDFDANKKTKDRFSMKSIQALDDKITRLEKLKERFTETKDEDVIMEDLKKRKETILKNVPKEGQTPYTEKVDGVYVDEMTKKMLNNVDISYKTALAEYSADKAVELLFEGAPETMTDQVMATKMEIQKLIDQSNEDVTAIGPTMSEISEQLMTTFEASISDQDRENYKVYLEGEKKHIRKVIGQSFYNRLGLNMYSAGRSSDLLKEFVMDPTTFTKANMQQKFMSTPMGLRIGEVHRLLGLAKDLAELRQRMMGEALTRMNMEGVEDGVKFDLVATHLFPPSQVELRLKYLKTLNPDDRAKFLNGPFMKAAKSVMPNLDIDSIDASNFLDTVSQLQMASRDYLQKITGSTFDDFKSLGEQISRVELALLSQVRSGIPTDEQVMPQTNAGEGEKPADPDSGAVQVIDGISFNPTYNPRTNGQIKRDAIDDEKRRVYLLQERSDNEAYVPMHVTPSKFFFGKDNYQALSGQFESMRPLIPKTSIKNPMSVISSAISQYGKVFGIKAPKTSFTSHPALIQKEAIELSELVNAYKSYISQTIGNYQHSDPMDESPDNPGPFPTGNPEPMQVEDAPEIPESKNKNVNPHSEGEEISNPLMSGLRGIMDRMQVERSTDIDRDIWAKPFG